jgi:hypothetical protein
MQNITSVTELKEAIQLLELEHGIKGRLLKDHLFLTYESLKPLNLLRNTLKSFSSPADLSGNLPGTAIGLFSGFLSNKIFVGASGNIARKLIGSVLQFGVTNLIARNSDVIKFFGQILYQHLFRKKALNSESRVG